MAKKEQIVKVVTGEDEDTGTKYICEANEFHFIVKVPGAFHTDANGNNKMPDIEKYQFTPLPQRDKHGKVDTANRICFFVASKEIFGDKYEGIVSHLEKLRANPMHKILLAAEYNKKRNPEAFQYSEQAKLLEQVVEQQAAENVSLKQQIEDLNKKLMGK